MQTAEINKSVRDALLEVIAPHGNQADLFLKHVECMKQYIRSARMLSRVCMAGVALGSESERDIQALAYLLNDVEGWLFTQECFAQENFNQVAYARSVLHEVIALSCDFESQSQAMVEESEVQS